MEHTRGCALVRYLDEGGDLTVEDPCVPGPRRGPGNGLEPSPIALVAATLSDFGNEVGFASKDVEVPPSGLHLGVSSGEDGPWMFRASGLAVSMASNVNLDRVLLSQDFRSQDHGPLNSQDEAQ